MSRERSAQHIRLELVQLVISICVIRYVLSTGPEDPRREGSTPGKSWCGTNFSNLRKYLFELGQLKFDEQK